MTTRSSSSLLQAVAAMALMLSSQQAFATLDPFIPLAKETIPGRWDGILGVEVLIVDFATAPDTARSSFAIIGHEVEFATTLPIKKLKCRDGHLVATFRSKNYDLLVDLKGETGSPPHDDGHMVGYAKIVRTDGRVERHAISLYKWKEESFLDHIAKLFQATLIAYKAVDREVLKKQ